MRRHSSIRINVVAATIPFPLKEIEQISGRRPGFGMAKTFVSSVPVHNLPVGRREEMIPEGTWSSSALTEVFHEVSTVMYSNEALPQLWTAVV